MNKLSRKSLIKKADKLFSLKIREMGVCELQGKDNVRCGGVLQCAHIVGRGRHVIRWNENNALCLCAGHHVYYTNNPEKWYEVISVSFPKKWKISHELMETTWDKDIQKIINALT